MFSWKYDKEMRLSVCLVVIFERLFDDQGSREKFFEAFSCELVFVVCFVRLSSWV